MLTLKTLATGSSGNCYLLDCDGEVMVLDLGIPVKEIKKGLEFDLGKVAGAVITHAHHDHSKSVKDFRNMGIPVWEPYKEEHKLLRHYFGGFMVRSFDVPHDDTPCCGFVIECPNGQRFLYATDFEYIKYSFRKLRIHHMLIEANYQNKYVENNSENKCHVFRGHAEINTTVGIVKDNADSLKTVILCHLSSKNINPLEALEEVKTAVKCPAYLAKKGMEIDLKDNDCPF